MLNPWYFQVPPLSFILMWFNMVQHTDLLWPLPHVFRNTLHFIIYRLSSIFPPTNSLPVSQPNSQIAVWEGAVSCQGCLKGHRTLQELTQSLPHDTDTISATPAPTRILNAIQENDYKENSGTAEPPRVLWHSHPQSLVLSRRFGG